MWYVVSYTVVQCTCAWSDGSTERKGLLLFLVSPSPLTGHLEASTRQPLSPLTSFHLLLPQTSRFRGEVKPMDEHELASGMSGLGLKRKALAPTPQNCPACEELKSKRSRGASPVSLHSCGVCQRIAAAPTCAHCTYRAACRHKNYCCDSFNIKPGSSYDRAQDVDMTGPKRRARARASTEHRTAGTALRRSPRWSTPSTDDVDMTARALPQDRFRTVLESPVDAYDGGDEGEE